MKIAQVETIDTPNGLIYEVQITKTDRYRSVASWFREIAFACGESEVDYFKFLDSFYLYSCIWAASNPIEAYNVCPNIPFRVRFNNLDDAVAFHLRYHDPE